ncbi:MAG: hypothetical protein CMP10_11745 [Zetaproteobacteria bacterium]|nr:hypothetical protein [Pseudobdellovibrionaceae bacterium]
MHQLSPIYLVTIFIFTLMSNEAKASSWTLAISPSAMTKSSSLLATWDMEIRKSFTVNSQVTFIPVVGYSRNSLSWKSSDANTKTLGSIDNSQFVFGAELRYKATVLEKTSYILGYRIGQGPGSARVDSSQNLTFTSTSWEKLQNKTNFLEIGAQTKLNKHYGLIASIRRSNYLINSNQSKTRWSSKTAQKAGLKLSSGKFSQRVKVPFPKKSNFNGIRVGIEFYL